MYTLDVYRHQNHIWVVQLRKNSGPVSWQFLIAPHLERAEAQAVKLFPQAVYVNGLSID